MLSPMKRLLFGLVIALGGAGCAHYHFETVVRRAEVARPDACGGEVAVQRLNAWAFRVDACDERRYYRCFLQRKTFGRTQCCYQVDDAGEATALLHAEPFERTCADFL